MNYCIAITPLILGTFNYNMIVELDDISFIERYASSWTLAHINGQTNESYSIHIFYKYGSHVRCLSSYSLFNRELKRWENKECPMDAVQNTYQLLHHHPRITDARPTCTYWEYQCTDGTCIHKWYMCDKHPDCLDSSDETNQICEEMNNITAACIRYGLESIAVCHCPQFFVRCMSGECIDSSRVCDGVANCKDNSDELLCMHSIYQKLTPRRQITTISDKCPNRWSLCNIFSNECFPNHMICVFIRSKEGALHCSNTEHLRYCAQHQCPSMFKCNQSYCIPTYMICDGIADCPDGEDELKCASLICNGNF